MCSRCTPVCAIFPVANDNRNNINNTNDIISFVFGQKILFYALISLLVSQTDLANRYHRLIQCVDALNSIHIISDSLLLLLVFFRERALPINGKVTCIPSFTVFFLLFIYNRTFYSLHSVSGCFLNCYSSLHWLGLALQDVMLFALYIGVYKMRKPFFSLLAAACCLLLLSLLPLDRRQKYFCSSAHT